ncbi:hypothetical protein F5B18DRAFT_540887 [Nemania serpens]|nr:hypothetical protein F5B18DRAFT_540887 [Nemania serpens]
MSKPTGQAPDPNEPPRNKRSSFSLSGGFRSLQRAVSSKGKRSEKEAAESLDASNPFADLPPAYTITPPQGASESSRRIPSGKPPTRVPGLYSRLRDVRDADLGCLAEIGSQFLIDDSDAFITWIDQGSSSLRRGELSRFYLAMSPELHMPLTPVAYRFDDLKTENASAALDVNIGNSSDEDDLPGMAHAVQHVGTRLDRLYSPEKQRARAAFGTKPLHRQPIERSFLPVLVGGKHIAALPDTNATCNVMTEQLAQSMGAYIKRSAAHTCVFTNAVGVQSRSVGETSLQVSFPDDPLKSWQCTFAVVQNCPEGLVFGDHFLRIVTETVTKFRHRLTKAVSGLARRTWRLMHMQRPRQKLGCLVDSELVFANADTGSDVDLVSLEYARFRGWDITCLPVDEGFVILSDGTIAKVLGYVDADLRVGGIATGERRFYVLDGLVADIILGDATLDELDVFNVHVRSFVDLEEVDGIEDFYMIEWVERLNKLETEVDRLLAHGAGTGAGTGASVVAAPRNTWDRLCRAAARRRVGLKVDHKPDDVKAELRRRLQDLDSVEYHLSSRSSKRIEGLVGDKLRREQLDNEARKARYCGLRTKILTSIHGLP